MQAMPLGMMRQAGAVPVLCVPLPSLCKLYLLGLCPQAWAKAAHEARLHARGSESCEQWEHY